MDGSFSVYEKVFEVEVQETVKAGLYSEGKSSVLSLLPALQMTAVV
jgi:hypothetical protein